MKDFDLRQGDVRARGRGFTLYPAAKEAEIDEDYMDTLLWAAESKFKNEEIAKKREDREKWPLSYTKAELGISYQATDIDTLIKAGLITKKGENEFTLTEKSIDIFLRAKKIDDELSAKGFYNRPCCRYC